MKLLVILFLGGISIIAKAVTIEQGPAKHYLLVGGAEGETVAIRLKTTLKKYDCNERTFVGRFVVDEDHSIAVADFGLLMTEINCPLEKPIVETVYSKSQKIEVKPNSEYHVFVSPDFELEVK